MVVLYYMTSANSIVIPIKKENNLCIAIASNVLV